MVSNKENIFQKNQKHKKRIGKAQGVSPKLGVPVGTLKSVDWHLARIRPIYPIFFVFRHFSDLL